MGTPCVKIYSYFLFFTLWFLLKVIAQLVFLDLSCFQKSDEQNMIYDFIWYKRAWSTDLLIEKIFDQKEHHTSFVILKKKQHLLKPFLLLFVSLTPSRHLIKSVFLCTTDIWQVWWRFFQEVKEICRRVFQPWETWNWLQTDCTKQEVRLWCL